MKTPKLKKIESVKKHHGISLEDDYAWVDLYLHNQYQGPVSTIGDENSMYWINKFGELVGGIGKVIAIVTEWEKPVMLTRIWCLFELNAAIDTGAELRFVSTAVERQGLSLNLGNQFQFFWGNALIMTHGNTGSITQALLKAKASERKSGNTFATSNKIPSTKNSTTLSPTLTNLRTSLATPMLLLSSPTCVFDARNSARWQRPTDRFLDSLQLRPRLKLICQAG